MRRSTRRDQGWMGAVAVGGLLLLATLFMRPSAAIHELRGKVDRDSAIDTEKPTRTVSRHEDDPSRQLLRKVAETYQNARSYRDRTIMRLERWDDPTQLHDKAELLVEFERPGRLRIDVQRDQDQLLLLSDGTQMYARIIDPGTNNFDNQLVVKPAPTSLTIRSLYELCEYARFDTPDQRQSALMSLPAPLLVSQLSLLLDPRAMTDLLEQAERIEPLADDKFHGLPSRRIRITTTGGDFVFWIDPYTAQLQRIDFPTPPDSASRDLSGVERPDPSADEPLFRLVAEFRDRRFDQPSRAHAFQLPISDASRRVRRFILPPEDRSGDLLGRAVNGFWFTDLYGDREHDHQWQGQIVVLVWFADHPASRAVLQEVQQVADRHLTNPRLRFHAICVEPSTRFSHRQVDDLLRNWSVRMPALRDLEAFGRDVFRIEQAPTLVVLDQQHRVQLVEIGGSSETDEQLDAVLHRLLEGENLAQAYRDQLEHQRSIYLQQLATVTLDPAPPR